MIIKTQNAPAAIGPYSQGVVAGNLLFISGCCPFSEKDGSVVGIDITEQNHSSHENLKAIVEATGSYMNDVVKTTCFISDMNNFQSFNTIYAGYFPSGTFPARSCVEVARLPKDVLIEVEAIVSLK